MLSEWLLISALTSSGTGLNEKALQKNLQQLAHKSDGQVGICAMAVTEKAPVCVNGEQKFPLQSVMKLIVAAAVMDAADRKKLQISDLILVKPEDASPGPQEFAELVKSKGSLKTSIEELMRRSIVDSDSTSVDLLIEHLGGIKSVQDFLKKKKIEGLRVDRNERDLQAEFSGLTWQPEFADSKNFEAAVTKVPDARREQALDFYTKDPRDTASPIAMVNFLNNLAAGKLLSEESTRILINIMRNTVTGPDRLRAGTPSTWQLGNKTGTSTSWKGMAPTTNDVGILTAPDGGHVAVAVFIANSSRSAEERASTIAEAAKISLGLLSSQKIGAEILGCSLRRG